LDLQKKVVLQPRADDDTLSLLPANGPLNVVSGPVGSGWTSIEPHHDVKG